MIIPLNDFALDQACIELVRAFTQGKGSMEMTRRAISAYFETLLTQKLARTQDLVGGGHNGPRELIINISTNPEQIHPTLSEPLHTQSRPRFTDDNYDK